MAGCGDMIGSKHCVPDFITWQSNKNMMLQLICLRPLQVHRGNAGPDGVRELPAGLPVCHVSQKQTARHQVAPPVLHIYRQEVRSFRSPGAASVIVLNRSVMSHNVSSWASG